MIWLKFFSKFIKILTSNVSPRQIAGGFVLGSFLGLAPVTSNGNLVIIAIILLVNVNITMALVGMGVFKVLHWPFQLDYFSDRLGGYLLIHNESLDGLWGSMSDVYITNTVGGFAIALILAVPLFIAVVKFVPYFREHLQEKIMKLKIIRLIQGSRIVNWYRRIKT